MNTNFDKKIFIDNLKNTCDRIKIKNFTKGETITSYIEKRNQFCILLSGEAELIRYDLNGNKNIIAHYNDYDTFGELFYPVTTNNELFVEAKKNSEVLFYTYDDIYSKCKRNCDFHKTLVDSLSQLFLNQIVNLNTRVEILTKRNIRGKILAYFDILSSRTLSKTIYLNFSYTDLADYLSVDRSAMMRELKLLSEEGFIKKDGNKIKLMYE